MTIRCKRGQLYVQITGPNGWEFVEADEDDIRSAVASMSSRGRKNKRGRLSGMSPEEREAAGRRMVEQRWSEKPEDNNE